MKIHQLSVFLENKPGHLHHACRALSENGINIITLSLADTHQFGILRLIVRDWEKARSVLGEAGFVVNVTEVVATEVEDRPGGLARILAVLDAAKVNIEYMYAFTFRDGDKAVLVFRFSASDAAIAALQQAGIQVLDGVSLYQRAEG